MLKLACLAALAHASLGALVTHWESPYSSEWAKSAVPVSDSGTVRFTIVMREQNIDKLKKIALEVSTPGSAAYGSFLTQAELDALTAPKASDVEVVREWLTSEGVDFVFRTASNIEVSTSVAKASRMLKTRFHEISNRRHRQSVVRASDYSLPSPVHEVTATIFGLHGLPVPPTKPLVMQATANMAPVTPSVLESTYKISGVKPTGSLKNRQAVAEFQGEEMSEQDLAQLFKKYVKDYKAGADDTVYKYVGAPKEEGYQVEAALDIQYIMAPAVGVKTEFWLFPAQDFCNDLNLWSSNLSAMADAPIVHSISYGWQGDLSQIHCQDKDVTAVDNNLAKLAAKGISIMVSSGDSGSGDSPVDFSCFEPNANGSSGVGLTGQVAKSGAAPGLGECCDRAKGSAGWTYVPYSSVSRSQPVDAYRATLPPPFPPAGTCTVYSKVSGTTTANSSTISRDNGAAVVELFPSWPASSPWVTAVGATRFVGQQVGNEEMASDQFGSGGGFSKQFSQEPNAKWQESAVASYLSTVDPSTLPPAGGFPPKGRATPDVSALGEGYQVVVDGAVNSVGGTSASCPAFAAIVSLLNEARLSAGKKQMGFLNPFLYANPGAFTDVVKGSNKIGRGGDPLIYGFNCSKGWDPVTGLGTPKFDKLLAAAMSA